MERTLAFTGHRPKSLPFGENELDACAIQLKAMMLTRSWIEQRRATTHSYAGRHEARTLFFGRQVLLVKLTTYPNIKLICAIPHEGQANGWSKEWKDRYCVMLEQADETVLISKSYARDCYHKRNRCGWRFVGVATPNMPHRPA